MYEPIEPLRTSTSLILCGKTFFTGNIPIQNTFIFDPSMSLFIAALNSGSNGNCYYIGNEEEAIFIDAGLACSEIEKRMTRLGLPMQRVKAIFISHEHKDHIFGVPTLAKKYHLPVYITPTTYKHGGMRIAEKQVFPFRQAESIQIGKLLITAFTKSHDAVDPHSFIVSYVAGFVELLVFYPGQ